MKKTRAAQELAKEGKKSLNPHYSNFLKGLEAAENA